MVTRHKDRSAGPWPLYRHMQRIQIQAAGYGVILTNPFDVPRPRACTHPDWVGALEQDQFRNGVPNEG